MGDWVAAGGGRGGLLVDKRREITAEAATDEAVSLISMAGKRWDTMNPLAWSKNTHTHTQTKTKTKNKNKIKINI